MPRVVDARTETLGSGVDPREESCGSEVADSCWVHTPFPMPPPTCYHAGMGKPEPPTYTAPPDVGNAVWEPGVSFGRKSPLRYTRSEPFRQLGINRVHMGALAGVVVFLVLTFLTHLIGGALLSPSGPVLVITVCAVLSYPLWMWWSRLWFERNPKNYLRSSLGPRLGCVVSATPTP